MIMRVYVVYDEASQEYAPPFFAKNEGVATRIYYSLLKEVDRNFRNNFKCFDIGKFDTENGIMIQEDKKEIEFTLSIEEETKKVGK